MKRLLDWWMDEDKNPRWIRGCFYMAVGLLLVLLGMALGGCGSAPVGLEGTFWVTPGLAVQNVAFGADGRYTLRTFHPDPALEVGTWTADATAIELAPDGVTPKHVRYTRSHDAKWLWLWWWSNGSTVYFRTQPPAP